MLRNRYAGYKRACGGRSSLQVTEIGVPGKAGRCHESQRFNDRAATSRALVVRVCGSGPRDGVEGAESVDEGGTGVHGHGDAEGFGDFLFCSAGFEGAVGMEGDTAVATRGDGYHNGDELTGFFAEKGVFGVGGGQSLAKSGMDLASSA
jgi:hypothetical protein